MPEGFSCSLSPSPFAGDPFSTKSLQFFRRHCAAWVQKHVDHARHHEAYAHSFLLKDLEASLGFEVWKADVAAQDQRLRTNGVAAVLRLRLTRTHILVENEALGWAGWTPAEREALRLVATGSATACQDSPSVAACESDRLGYRTTSPPAARHARARQYPVRH
ncbi:MAG: hypothetical protein JO352_15820 [Chloroflexi bacterium]|nr:hypothetical protein [Chloroflexota bacterium]